MICPKHLKKKNGIPDNLWFANGMMKECCGLTGKTGLPSV